jgi:Flp pilus assembly protein TadD
MLSGFSRRHWLPLVFVVSLVVRLPVVWMWQRSPLANCLGTDPQHYMSSAARIAAGGWTETHGLLVGGPLYPYFLGVLMKLVAPGTAWLRVIQAAVGALGGTLIAALGSRLFSRTTGLLAAAGTVLFGPLLANELGFENEFLSVPIVAGALLLLASTRASWRAVFGAGLLLGLAALLRGSEILVTVVAASWLLAEVRPWRAAIARTALLGAGVVVALIPVTARNLATLGEPAPLGALGGYVFYLGHNEGASWRYAPVGFGNTTVAGEAGAAIAEASRRAGRALSPGEASAYWYAEGLRFVAARPGTAIRNTATKLLAFFQPGELPDNYDFRFLREEVPPLRALCLSFGIVVPFAAIGLLGLRSRRQVLVLIPPLAGLLTVIGFYYNARFRLPAVPFILLLAAEGVALVISFVRDRDARGLRRATVAAGATVGLIALAPGFRDDFYFPWVLAAQCSARTEPARAELFFRRAMDLHPREPEARVGLARLLAARDDAHGAREVLAPLPLHPPALVLLASMDVGEGRYESAVAYLEAALERDPALTSAWNDLGVLHASSGRLDDAVAAFERALALDPNGPEALRNIAMVRLESGDAEQALRDLERALARRDEKDLRLLAGAAALRAGLSESARRHLAQARRMGATPAEIQEATAP